MSIWHRVNHWLDGLLVPSPGPLDAEERAFRTGPAVVERFEEVHGHDQTAFTPETFGSYIATSVAVYACVNLRAKNLATLPLRLWKVNARGKRTEVTSGPLFELLQFVNPFWSIKRLIYQTELTLCLWGQAHWTLERGQSGHRPPREIWWARPDRMRPVPHPVQYLAGFIYQAGGAEIPFRTDEVVWLRYPNPIDEYSGLSPIAAARLSVDTQQGAIRSNRGIFSHGMQMAGVISPENKDHSWTPDKVKLIEEHFARRFQGADKAHRVAVLGQTARFQAVQLSPRDAQFVELMRWGKGEVATVYGIAPELIGDHEHATYNNLEQAEQSLWTDTLIPEAEFLANELTRQLLPLFAGEADVAEFDLSGIHTLQEDRSAVVAQMQKLWQMGVPLNRLLQEFQPYLLPEGEEGYPWGDVGYVSRGMAPLAGNGEAPPADERADEDAGPGPTLEDQARRALEITRVLGLAEANRHARPPPIEHERIWTPFYKRTRQHEERFTATLRALWQSQEHSALSRLRCGKGIHSKDDDEAAVNPFERAVWGKRFKQAVLPILRAALVDAGGATLDDLGVGVAFDVDNPRVARWIERRANRCAREVNQTTWDDLKAELGKGIDAGEGTDTLAERVRTLFRRYLASDPAASEKLSRAEMIAKAEVIAASNAGAIEAAQQSGVVESKTW